MLKKHFDHIENVLLAKLKQSSTLGHPVDKGNAREIFVKEFLRQHLGENIGIGTGEIIDSDSKPGDKRHQHDIVIYRKDYPKLHFAEGIDAFLAESVVATVEVKSSLDDKDMEQAVKAAYNVKKLKRYFANMWTYSTTPPSIRSYVFAFECKATMLTVGNWFGSAHKKLGIKPPQMGSTREERLKTASPALDGVIVLYKGTLHVDNIPLVPMGHAAEVKNPKANYFINETSANNLLILFLWLTEAINQVALSMWDYGSYLPKE